MIDTLTSQLNPANSVARIDDTLRLKCPCCGDGLNLKRKHLGLTGQCVHCKNPLTAVEENGEIRVVSDSPSPHLEIPAPMESVVAKWISSVSIAASSPASVGEAAPPIPASWGFPDFTAPLRQSVEPIGISAPVKRDSQELSRPLPGREGDNLFVDRGEPTAVETSKPENKPEPSPFGQSTGFALSFSSPFLTEESAPEINPAWGTNVPRETHASNSPFGTGSAGGGGFAESLFREKVEKDSAGVPTPSMAPQASLFATIAPSAESGSASPEAGANRDSQERVILDGDGRPMRPMTKEEEGFFATSFMKHEHGRSAPRWGKRIRKAFFRLLIFICVIGIAGGALAYFTPKEQLLVWKEKVINWLEPGMAIVDYLPEKLRPDWLPRTEFGIDAGVDGNGQPMKKLNALEGLDKLRGNVGNIRGAADDELKRLDKL